MHLNIPTLQERILAMSEDELEQLAEGEALAIAESSRLEGLILDQERIRIELIAGYRLIRSKQQPTT